MAEPMHPALSADGHQFVDGNYSPVFHVGRAEDCEECDASE